MLLSIKALALCALKTGIKRPSVPISRSSRSHTFYTSTSQRLYPSPYRTPCKLAYIKPCKCWQLQPYVNLDPNDQVRDGLRGSPDPMLEAKGKMTLEDDLLEIGEVVVSPDGLLHPDTACMPFY